MFVCKKEIHNIKNNNKNHNNKKSNWNIGICKDYTMHFNSNFFMFIKEGGKYEKKNSEYYFSYFDFNIM